MSNIYWPGVITVMGLYVVSLVIGRRAARKAKEGTATDLILAGRSLPLWLAVMTMTATWVDGATSTGRPRRPSPPAADRLAQRGYLLRYQPSPRRTLLRPNHEATRVHDPRRSVCGSLRQTLAAVLVCRPCLAKPSGAGLLVASARPFRSSSVSSSNSPLSVGRDRHGLHDGGRHVVGRLDDAFQLLLIPVGLLATLALTCWRRPAASTLPEHSTRSGMTAPALRPPLVDIIIYFGVLTSFSSWVVFPGTVTFSASSCSTPARAASHSILAGVLTTVFPPLILGMVPSIFPQDPARSAWTLPLLLLEAVPPLIGLLGLAAIVGAVTSSYSSSILSAARCWLECYRPLVVAGNLAGRPQASDSLSRPGWSRWRPSVSLQGRQRLPPVDVHRRPGLCAAFPASGVFVDRKVNVIGSARHSSCRGCCGWEVGRDCSTSSRSSITRVFPGITGRPGDLWYDQSARHPPFPVRILAATAGLILLPIVSRLTARWCPPQPLDPYLA